MSNEKFSNKEYTPAQLEYFQSQTELKEYFAKKVNQTLTAVQQYIQKKQSSGETLELKNNPNAKYYLMEDGTIFKYLSKEVEFYILDTKEFIWYPEPSLLGLYFDNTLTFREIPDFKDYYTDCLPKEEKSSIKL